MATWDHFGKGHSEHNLSQETQSAWGDCPEHASHQVKPQKNQYPENFEHSNNPKSVSSDLQLV